MSTTTLMCPIMSYKLAAKSIDSSSAELDEIDIKN
jgi:hypothetical protein